MIEVYVTKFVQLFFQAEDVIRDDLVTGVQTCALPIYREANSHSPRVRLPPDTRRVTVCLAVEKRRDWTLPAIRLRSSGRSEERRVGDDGGSRVSGGICI